MGEILQHIPRGRENAVSMATLAAKGGISERKVRKLIHDARKAGALIIGDKYGYYQPANQEELKRYVKTQRRRALGSLANIKPARLELETTPGQESMEV